MYAARLSQARVAHIVFGLGTYFGCLAFDRLMGTEDSPDIVRKRAQQLRETLTELGPSFIKAGQVLANRPDIVREDYMNELCILQVRLHLRCSCVCVYMWDPIMAPAIVWQVHPFAALLSELSTVLHPAGATYALVLSELLPMDSPAWCNCWQQSSLSFAATVAPSRRNGWLEVWAAVGVRSLGKQQCPGNLHVTSKLGAVVVQQCR